MNFDMAKEMLDDSFRFTVDDICHTIRELDLPLESRILDVGTGKGNLAISLAMNGYRVLTGEPEEDATVYAKQDWLGNACKVGVDHLIDYQVFDACKMPFDANTFDAVFCLGSLHHIEEVNRAKVLEEFARTVRPDGIICIFEPNPLALAIIKEIEALHPDAAAPGDLIQGLNLSLRKIEGTHFDIFILT